MVFGGGSTRVSAFGPQGAPQDPPDDGGDVDEVPDECWVAMSQFRIEINMSGGPQHQIPYCWDKNVNASRGDGKYDVNGWNNGNYQRRWCEPDDMYSGSFTIRREVLFSGTDGGCGDHTDSNTGETSTDCPDIEGCCYDNSFADAGKTLMALSYEIWEYVTPAPQAIGKRPPADVPCEGGFIQGPCLRKHEEGLRSFDLCDTGEVVQLKELRDKLEPWTHTHEIKLTAVITSVNSRQKCFKVPDAAEFQAELNAWLGGRVDGEYMWDEIREMCVLGPFMEVLGGLAGVQEKLCEKMTEDKCHPDETKGPVGYFHMSRKMPTGCPRPRPGNGPFADGNGPSNWFAVRLFGGQPRREMHPESSAPYWEHGESNNPEFTEEGNQGTRENILGIIDAVIGNPSDRLCEQHKALPINILKGMGKYGKGVLCTGLKIKGWEDNFVAFWRLPQPVNMGLAWCFSAVRKLLGG